MQLYIAVHWNLEHLKVKIKRIGIPKELESTSIRDETPEWELITVKNCVFCMNQVLS